MVVREIVIIGCLNSLRNVESIDMVNSKDVKDDKKNC